MMKNIVEIFKALADPTRLRIVHLLLQAKQGLCVCEFVDSLEEFQYNISKHLRVLEKAGLIISHKEGKWVYYSLVKQTFFQDYLLKAISQISSTILDKDIRELDKRLNLRIKGKCLCGVRKKRWLKAVVK